MPRPRNKENLPLQRRWRIAHGAYYYQVPPGQEEKWDGKQTFRLGKTYSEACRTWAERMQNFEQKKDEIKSIGDLLNKYEIEVVPKKAPSSQSINKLWISTLRLVFGQMRVGDIKPKHIYEYVARRSVKKIDPETGKVKGGQTAARREIEVLSHAYTMAVEWGVIDRHPFKNEVRITNAKPRDRYVEDWEIDELFNLESTRKKGSLKVIQSYIRIKLMTGMSRGDLLRLTASNLTEDGILIRRHKTEKTSGKKTIYVWTPELRTAIQDAISARPALSSFIFCNKEGKGYINEENGTCHGWDSMWGRFMDRVMSETKITERFHEHDLRAKAASDADTLDHARALLSHADVRTTELIYRRKAEVVKPLTLANFAKKSA